MPVLLLFTVVILYGIKDQQKIKKVQKSSDNITVNEMPRQKKL